MNLVHLTASFFGGPERQMLGLALAMPESVRTTFATFPEGGCGGVFLDEVRKRGFSIAPYLQLIDTMLQRAPLRVAANQN